jgi:hypothetical protein
MDDMQPTMTIDADGNKFWSLNGGYHREDGPAAEWADGDKYWWLNDRVHRIDGPAIEWDNGSTAWYLHGINYRFDEWLEANTDLTDGEKVMMKLQHG